MVVLIVVIIWVFVVVFVFLGFFVNSSASGSPDVNNYGSGDFNNTVRGSSCTKCLW